MATTFQFAFDRNSNSSVQEIEVRRTRTQYCPKHLFIVFRHKHGGNTSAEIVKRQDVEWTRDIPLHPSDFIKFGVTDTCPGIQDLAIYIFNQEHHTDLQNPGLCGCFPWVLVL